MATCSRPRESGVAVHHQVQLDRFAVVVEDVAVGPLELLEQLLVAVPGLEARRCRGRRTGSRCPAGHGVGSSRGSGVDPALLHGQDRHGPVQSLDLRFLVHTQHDRAHRDVVMDNEVEPADVGDLPDQLGIGGEPERLRSPTVIRLDPVGPPRPLDRKRADPEPGSKQSARPVRDPQPCSGPASSAPSSLSRRSAPRSAAFAILRGQQHDPRPLRRRRPEPV